MSNLSRRVLIAGAAIGVAAASLAYSLSTTVAAPSGKAQIGPWGFDLAGMDRSVKPGDDFYRYAGGTWMKNTKIPADRTRWGSFNELAAKSEEDVKNIVQQVSSRSNAAGTPEQKVADFYSSYMDTKAIDTAGLKPFQADLARLAALKDANDIATLMGDPGIAGNAPIAFAFGLDDKNPDRYSLDLYQSGLGLPDRDYYLKTDAKFVETVAKYRAYIAQMLKMANYPDAAKAADAIVAVEHKIAEIQWPNEKLRDVELAYNPRTLAELKNSVPDFNWDAALKAGSLSSQNFFLLRNPEPIAKLATLIKTTPIETWRAYFTFHYLNQQADIMPTAFDDAAFEFNGRVLQGQQQKQDRWKRAVRALSGDYGERPLGQAIGQIYVKDHFTPEAKAQVREIVDNLLASYRERISKLDWMSPETRKVAMLKAQTVRIKIGFPDNWRDYSALEIKAGDVYGNRVRSSLWDWKRQASRLAQKTDKSEWGMSPQTVNAYYNPSWNEIVFPAAILQPPFFDPNADPAVNYGGIGGVIGHEMGHGYDDQGAKSDEKGILHVWWNKQDIERFDVKVKALAAQYSKFEPLPGLHVNGEFTSGENMGDLGGVSVAHAAYLRSLKGQAAPVLDGFSGEQRFFLGWAQVWRALYREEALRVQVTSNEHSPAEYRCNGVVRNVDSWYDSYSVKPGDKMYLAPNERVHIW